MPKNKSIKRYSRYSSNKKSSSITTKIKSLFYNREYLYFISLISILYFLSNAINHNYLGLVVFMITGVFTFASYSKNMSIVLTMTCVITFVISSIIGKTLENKEGMTDNSEEETPPPSDKQTSSKTDTTKQKKTEKLTPLQPANFNSNKSGDFDVDLASTLEQSYGMLNNLLDNDGISNLTGETKRLISEQKKLFESMNSMAPLIGQAKEMLGMFNTNDFKQMEGLAQKTMQNLNKNGSQPSMDTKTIEGLQRKVQEGLQRK
jgi:hypothetical protein